MIILLQVSIMHLIVIIVAPMILMVVGGDGASGG